MEHIIMIDSMYSIPLYMSRVDNVTYYDVNNNIITYKDISHDSTIYPVRAVIKINDTPIKFGNRVVYSTPTKIKESDFEHGEYFVKYIDMDTFRTSMAIMNIYKSNAGAIDGCFLFDVRDSYFLIESIKVD